MKFKYPLFNISKNFILLTCLKKNSKFNKVINRTMTTLETINFDNQALKCLPIDKSKLENVRQVRGACYSLVSPTPVINPSLIVYSVSAMKLLDLNLDELLRPEFIKYFSGNDILKGSESAAHCYCGNQFGNFAGQLGDGAAIYLGEVLNEFNKRYEVQLKGAGLTPFSRSADGRKVLRSSLREFLCSEAMHHLGIPTTRAGSCITSDSTVIRDIFYNGNPINEKCTIVCRIAPTFIRFGSFQICNGMDAGTGKQGPSFGNPEVIQKLADYVIKFYYPEIWEKYKNMKEKDYMYIDFFGEVVDRTAKMVALWQSVGFCHGVLNTDNMSILGLTIDYGPFGYMDNFNEDYICNASDSGGRYTYKNQPKICKWNCKKLAESLKVFVPYNLLSNHVEKFDELFEIYYLEKMRAKFGFFSVQPSDKVLIEQFFTVMQITGADFTRTFNCLSKLKLPGSIDFEQNLSTVKQCLIDQCATLEELKKMHKPRLSLVNLRMFIENPSLLGLIGLDQEQLAIEIRKLENLESLKSMTEDLKREADLIKWTYWLHNYVDRLKFETSNILSSNLDDENFKRMNLMNANNPKFVLRNYIAQNAINAAEHDDYKEVWNVLKLLEHPYQDISELQKSSNIIQEHEIVENLSKYASYYKKVPQGSTNILVT